MCKVFFTEGSPAHVITLAFLFTKETKQIEVNAAESQILFLFHIVFIQVASIFLKRDARSLTLQVVHFHNFDLHDLSLVS